MAYDVEDKVVQMRFDNRDFDPNIDASIKSLEKLETSLKLANGTKGFENVGKAAKNFNLNSAITAVESLKNGFSAMEIAGITAISNIANRATNLSLNILKSIFVTPISTGWQEYGMQMDSTQVIMANTGDEIDRVTDSLNALNEYADLTIYSFSQMTQAIGKFAAASVDLDSSVAAIKGLSNAAALVGANNQNLYSAYYNLSQALQLGALTAIDWRPLQYSMIGTRTMQKVFIETAIALGKFTRESEQAQKAFTDFKGSLSSKWLDKDVIVNGLKVYSLNFEELTKQVDSATGEIYYLNKEGEKIPEWMAKLGDSATRSATEIRNLKQLWDVIREEAQTGWSANWKIIVGDLNESKRLWTNVGDRIRSILDVISSKTKEVITSWRNSGGRDTFINFLSTSLDNLRIGLTVFYRVLDKIIPISTDLFTKFTDKLNDTANAFHLSKEQAESLTRVLIFVTKPLQFIVKAYIAIGKILFTIITTVIDAIKIFIKILNSFENGILDLLYLIGIDVNNLINIFYDIRNAVYIVFNSILSFIRQIFKIIYPVLLSIGSIVLTLFNTIIKIVNKLFSSNFINVIINLLNTVYVILHLISITIIGILNIIEESLNNGAGDFIASLVVLLGNILYILSKVALIGIYVVSSVLEKASPLLFSIGNLLSSIVNLLLKVFSIIFGEDLSGIDDLFNKFIYILSIGIDKLGNFISKIAYVIDMIAEGINNGNLVEVGQWIVLSIADGLVNAIPKLLTGLVNMCGFIINTIRNILQIHSQSPLFFGIGLWIPKSIAAAEEKGAKETEKASEALSNSIFSVFINNRQHEIAEKELQSWNNTLETLANTFSETAIPRLVLAGIALLGLITIVILLIDRIPKVGAIFDFIDNLGDSLLFRSLGQLLLDFGRTLLLISAAFILLRVALNEISDVEFARLMSVFTTMNTLIIVFAILAKTLTKTSWVDIGKIGAFQLFIRSITISLMLLVASLLVLARLKIDNSTNLALLGLLNTFLILTALAVVIARTARNFFTTLGGIVIIDLVIIAIIAILRELIVLSDHRFDSSAINSILGGITACILALSIMSRFIVRNVNQIWRAMFGMLLIHLSTIALIPLIQVMHAVSNKHFDSKNFIISLLGIVLSITMLSVLAKVIVRSKEEMLNVLMGIIPIQAATWALVPLIQVMHAIGNKNFDSENLIWVLTALTTSVMALSIFTLTLSRARTGFKGMLLAILNVMTSTSAIARLIDKFKDITNKNIDARQLFAVLLVAESAIAGLAAIASKIVGGSFKNISSAIAGLFVVVNLMISFIILLNALEHLTMTTNYEEIFTICSFITIVISALTTLATKIVSSGWGMLRALIGTIVIDNMVTNLCYLMKRIAVLSNINIPYSTIDQLLMLYSIVGLMSLIAIAIGHGTYYVAIGAAAIIALSFALLITAQALNVLSMSKMDVLIAGLKSLQNILGKDFGYSVLMLLSLAILIPILALLAPAIAIISVSMVIMADAINIASKAIVNIINAFKPFLLLFEAIDNKLSQSTGFEDRLQRLVDIIKNNSDALHKGILDIAGAIAALGAAFAALGIGLSLIVPFLFMILKLVDQLDLVSKFINELANNSENIDKLLNAIEKHLEAFRELIFGIIGVGIFDKGRTFRILIIGIAKAFMYAARGLVPFGLGIIKLAQGILWLSVAIYIAKNLIGEDLKNFFDSIRNGFKLLVDQFGRFNAILITMGRILNVMNTISIFTLWLRDIGYSLQSFGSGLIKTGLGIIILSLAIKSVAKTINELEPGQLYAIIGGIFKFILMLGTVSTLLAPVAPLMNIVSRALLKMSISLLVLSGAMALFIYVTKALDGDFRSLYLMLGFISTLTLVLGILTPLLILAGIGTGTLGVGLLILSASLAALIGIINLLQNTLGGFDKLWEMLGFIAAMTGALGALSIPAFIAGIAIGTLGAGLIALSAGLLALVGVLAVFGEVMTNSEFLQNFMIGILDFIHSWFINITTAIKNYVLGIIRFIRGFISNLKNIIINGFNTIGFWIPESIKDGITSAIDTVFTAAENLAKGIEETIRNILQIHSESPKFWEIGWWTDESMADGMSDNAHKVIDTAKNVATGIWDTIDKATNGGASNFVKNTKKKFEDLKDSVFGLFDPKNKDGLFGGIADALENLDFSKWSEIADIDFDKVDLDEYASSLANINSTASATKGTIESLTDTLKNQMKIFERFTYDEEMIKPAELINNMKSQLRGMQNWANGLDILTARGISGPLLQYLSEMGPEGYKYVEAFLEMTEDEFAQANELYSKSLDMPGSVANQIADDYRALGVDIVEAVKSGGSAVTKAAGEETENTVETVHNIAVSGTNTTLETIDRLAKENGPKAMMHYCNEAGDWLDTDEFNALAVKMQGKLTGVMHLPMSELIRKSGLKQVFGGQMNAMTYELMKRDYGKETGLFYIDNMTKALTATEYLDECSNRGEIISAYISSGINPGYFGELNGQNYDEALADGITDNKDKPVNATVAMAEEINSNNVSYDDGYEAGINYCDGLTDAINNWNGEANIDLSNKISDKYKNNTSHITEGEITKNNSKWSNILGQINSKQWIKYVVDGVELGASTYAARCSAAGKLLGAELINGTTTELGIASPSKEYEQIAKFSVLGFVDGIMKNLNLAENASETLGDDALASLADTIQAISSQFTDDMDTTPTIRPVLDLDNVYTGMAELDTMFSTNQARIAGSAYMTTHDDSVERLEDAYRKAIMDGNLELANMLLNSDNTNVTVEVHLDANAEGIFDLVKTENKKATERTGASPLMIARRNAINAGLA